MTFCKNTRKIFLDNYKNDNLTKINNKIEEEGIMMKKIYEAPKMYCEEFVPNVYASGCAPGIDESTAEAYVETCYYLKNGWSGCSGVGTELYFFIEGNKACTDVWLKKDGTAGTRGEISIVWENFEFDGDPFPRKAYRWSNQHGGWHYIPVSELGGTVDGKPKYFCS